MKPDKAKHKVKPDKAKYKVKPDKAKHKVKPDKAKHKVKPDNLCISLLYNLVPRVFRGGKTLVGAGHVIPNVSNNLGGVEAT